jgi:long-chain acyl-CoA synthetase
VDLAAHGLIPPPRRPVYPSGRTQCIAQVFDWVLEEDPTRLALIGRSGRLSYAELEAATNRVSAALAKLGIGVGDRVAACLPNDVDIVVAFLGTIRLGAIWVGVNRPLAGAEKAYLLKDSGASVYLANADMADEIEPLGAGIETLRHVVRVDPQGASDCEWARLCRETGNPERPAASASLDPFEPAAIAYTSGTTGHPKGAVHSHHNLLLPGAVSASTGLYSAEVRQGVVLPLTILNLVVLAPLTAFQVGSACVAMDRIDPVGLAAWVKTEQVGHFAAVPTIIHDLLTHPDVTADDLASLRSPMVGGADCPEEFRDLYRDRFGKEVGIGYGMTEAPTAVTSATGAPAEKPGLCGTALPQIEIQVWGEDDRPQPAGELGEICVGPSKEGDWAGVYTPMLGYWNRPEATAEALRGGVYHTGDVGFLEEDGTLYIRGRRNELILRGGANVYPAEVERVLGEHPAVGAVAVFGLPDERLGERVVAVVQLEAGATATAEDLAGHVRDQLARYKTPEQIRFVDEMPRNAMNKIVKRELHGLFA